MTLDIAEYRRRFPAVFVVPIWRRAALATGTVLVLTWVTTLCVWFDITPVRLGHGLSGLLVILRQMIPPSPGSQWLDILHGLAESVAMALLGTVVAAVIALPLGLLGSRNVVVNALAHFSVRRLFDGFRGVDQLIWALAFVRAFGLGPLAGVLAVTVTDIFMFAKLFAEAIENADACQPEAIVATGGSRLAVVRFGLLPQIMPVLLAQVLYGFEANTRGASILGVVGAGGIGLQIAERIRVRYWDEVAFIIILILVTITAIDQISARLRRRLVA